MSIIAQAIAADNAVLDQDTVTQILYEGLENRFTGTRVLALIPDHTRTVPLPMLFRELVKVLHDVQKLDFMVALGTHPPLPDAALYRLVGITPEEHRSSYSHIRLLNHDWKNPENLTQLGTISQDQVKSMAGEAWHPTLGGDVPVNINCNVLDYDHILIVGPTFPHEVVGFSGGAKYLFPGISGAEMIDVTHWMSALVGVVKTIGVKDTPVRRMIHTATEMLPTPVTLLSMVVVGDDLAGIFIGDHVSAWSAAADLSAERHIRWCEKPFKRILSNAPRMYDELWTAGKAMYKLEPVLAEGGELMIYSPYLDTVSRVHGDYIFQAGYHVMPYFLNQWDKFKHIPLGVLAHSTHVRGAGRFEDGVEYPRAKVTLATSIPRNICEQLSLGYFNPTSIKPDKWADREDESILYVPKAGEILYRLASEREN